MESCTYFVSGMQVIVIEGNKVTHKKVIPPTNFE